jgi:hypothetical protein
MKETIVVVLLLTMLSLDIKADTSTYIEYKNKYDLTKNKTENFLRLGVKGKHFYIESGNKSAEAGYKFQHEKITFKGKVESTKNFKKTTLETEVRVTF